jgi:hypothetical protein
MFHADTRCDGPCSARPSGWPRETQGRSADYPQSLELPRRHQSELYETLRSSAMNLGEVGSVQATYPSRPGSSNAYGSQLRVVRVLDSPGAQEVGGPNNRSDAYANDCPDHLGYGSVDNRATEGRAHH